MQFERNQLLIWFGNVRKWFSDSGARPPQKFEYVIMGFMDIPYGFAISFYQIIEEIIRSKKNVSRAEMQRIEMFFCLAPKEALAHFMNYLLQAKKMNPEDLIEWMFANFDDALIRAFVKANVDTDDLLISNFSFIVRPQSMNLEAI